MTITDRYAPVRKRTHIPSRPYSGFRAPPVQRTFTKPKGPTPILALDVDGPCSPFRASDKVLRNRGFRDVSWRDEIEYQPGSRWVPYSKLWLSPKMGAALAAFSRRHNIELIWATMWEKNAVTIVSPVLGLPRLDYVDFHGHPVNHLWKYPAMLDYAAGRPLAWLDDSFSDKNWQRIASRWSARRSGLPTLLHEVDARVGITARDLDEVASWLATARLAW